APSEEKLNSFLQEPAKFTKVGFNCLACHAGQVQVSTMKVLPLIGAPNTRINNPLFLMAKTSLLPKFTSDHFRQALRTKPAGWIYQDPKMAAIEAKERETFLSPGVAEELVSNIKTNSALLMGGFNLVKKFAYSKPNAPDPMAIKRGSMDALIPTYLAFLAWAKTNSPDSLTPENLSHVMPLQAAEVDPPSMWNQRGRGNSHWDGSMGGVVHRNAGAAQASLSKPVNLENISKITAFLEDLPSDPYPFDVDMERARTGKQLFQSNCVSCHGNQNKVISAAEIGTDANRMNHFTAKGAQFLGGLLALICGNGKHCTKATGEVYSPAELSIKTDGYVGGRLDGIWARAPYLHNGSVPTLYALLTNDRPEKFYRGALTYDREKVGFTWDKNLPGSVEYNTKLDGNSNQGHSDPLYLGKNWKNQPEDLKDLLEYLKTL
ncbi:MAG: c-type cytochrome, partial [Bdellovibrionales bacterium]